MPYDKPIINTSNPYRNETSVISTTRTIFYGEVVDIIDPTNGGRIKIKIPDLDNKTPNAELPWCYPMMPKFFHIFPKVGEYVRVFIEDIKFPQRSRYWMGSVISQLQKLEFDSIYTALSTTNMALTTPLPAEDTYPDAIGVYPSLEDIALLGRINTDVTLKPNQVQIRAGKHENGNVLKLNTENPATFNMIFEPNESNDNYYSNSILASDKIAIISHEGNPKFKATRLTPEDRQIIFNNGHPIVRGDVLVEALNIIRNALINHIHGYSGIAADKTSIINTLENLNFDGMLQKNIVTN